MNRRPVEVERGAINTIDRGQAVELATYCNQAHCTLPGRGVTLLPIPRVFASIRVGLRCPSKRGEKNDKSMSIANDIPKKMKNS